jgi:hypothetical protein
MNLPSESDNLDEQSNYEAERCLRLEKHRRAREPRGARHDLAAFNHLRGPSQYPLFLMLLTVLTADKAKEAKEKEGKGFASQ